MSTEISNNTKSLYEGYVNLYVKKFLSQKKCLSFKTFSSRIESGKVVRSNNCEFMNVAAFKHWLNSGKK